MRPPAITAVLLTLPFILLSACGSANDNVIQNSPTTYSVSAETGSSDGGWDKAKAWASYKATQFCERTGKQVALRDEQRSSNWFPGAPQKSTITFECVSDPGSSGGEAATPAPAANAKRMAA